MSTPEHKKVIEVVTCQKREYDNRTPPMPVAKLAVPSILGDCRYRIKDRRFSDDLPASPARLCVRSVVDSPFRVVSRLRIVGRSMKLPTSLAFK